MVNLGKQTLKNEFKEIIIIIIYLRKQQNYVRGNICTYFNAGKWIAIVRLKAFLEQFWSKKKLKHLIDCFHYKSVHSF